MQVGGSLGECDAGAGPVELEQADPTVQLVSLDFLPTALGEFAYAGGVVFHGVFAFLPGILIRSH